MPSLEAKRTLVKSPPELWAELSDVESLARHLGEFGEIKITRREPESIVEWEGDRASGTVQLEPSGWGTKVTLTAEAVGPEPPEVRDEPVAAEPEPEPEPPDRPGFFARWFRRRPEPEAVAEVEPEPADDAPAQAEPTLEEQHALGVLTGVLDTLGAAHHRPFSR